MAVVAAIGATGCSTAVPSGSRTASDPVSSVTPTSAASGSASPSAAAEIPQPSVAGLDVADPSARVDLAMPTFSNPTEITNPLFPVGLPSSNLLVGTVDDKAFRTEVTVLPTTRMVLWGGQLVETVVSQYVAFLDGEIHEVAYDLYAQADDGSVWYFGEDVFNFADGAIVDTHGTWHAGINGPAAMIMPGDPTEGDVYRPENIPGLVFEEVVVRATDQVFDGPFGSIEGGIVVRELHADGSTEDKSFAPGYGEFYTGAGGDTEALAMAVPPDTADGSMPDALANAIELARGALQAALDDDLAEVERLAGDLEASVAALGDGDVPLLLRPLLEAAVSGLLAAPADGGASAANAAIAVGRLLGDLELRYRPIPEVDLERLGLWGAQLVVDAGEEDLAAVRADSFALTYTRERLVEGIGEDVIGQLNVAMESLQSAVDDEDFEAMAEVGETIRSIATAGG